MFKKIGIVALLAICLVCLFTACTPKEKPCVHQSDLPIEQVDATCVKDGTVEYKTCIWCGKHFDANDNELTDLVIPAKGHSFGDWVRTKKPTATKEGVETRTCGVCYLEETRAIPVLVETSFTISYDLNGGTMYSEIQNPTTFKNIDDDIAIVAVPYKQGYVFTGWSHGDEEPNADYVIESGTEQNLTLVANYTEDTTMHNGGNVDINPQIVTNYLAATNKAEFLWDYASNGGLVSNPLPVKMNWESANTAATSFTLTIAYDKDFTDLLTQRSVTHDTAFEYNLLPKKTYFYKIVDNFGNVVKMDSFVINETVRTINLGNIDNVRDIGGYAVDNGTLRYGLAFRTPEIKDINAAGLDILVNQLGVKTEIDLRLEATTKTVDPSINKLTLGIIQWDYMFPNMNSNRPHHTTYTNNLKEIIKTFANKDNYPILFHCSAGADRTGTVAFLLNGLLGVSYDDLVADFEITSFYKGGRWRSMIKKDENGSYYFDDSGVMMDNTNNLVDFDRCYRYVMDTYADESETLADAIEKYLTTVVGVTQAEIAAIKQIWIEPNTTTTQKSQQITRWQNGETTDSQKLAKTLNAPVVDTSKKQDLQDETVA